MAKPPSDDPRVIPFSMKLTKGEAEKMDKARGGMPKSDWARKVLFGGRKR